MAFRQLLPLVRKKLTLHSQGIALKMRTLKGPLHQITTSFSSFTSPPNNDDKQSTPWPSNTNEDSNSNPTKMKRNDNSAEKNDGCLYTVYRLDDNDHQFDIETFSTAQEADEFVQYMQRTKHKQKYFVKIVR